VSWVIEPLVPVGLIALAAFVLAFAELAPLWRARAVVSGPARVAVSLLFLAGVALAVLPLLGPRLERERPRPEKVLILVDSSRSMATEDACDGASRYAAALGVARALAASAPQARFETRAFDETTHDLTIAPLGGRTAIGEAIARTRALPDPPVAIVLVTDGAQTSGGDAVSAAREARASGVQVATVLVGDPGRAPPPRIESVELEAPRRVAVGARTTVHVSAELEGLDGAPIETTLFLDGVEVGRVPIEASGPRTRREARFELVIDASGEHTLAATVRSGARTGKATRRLRAVSAPLRAALIDRPARWEHRFLRRALEDLPRVALHRVDLWNAEPDARASAAAIAAVASADVIILGDVPRRLLAPELGSALLAAVDREGAGILLLGGRHAFGAALDLGLGEALPAEAGDDLTPVTRSFRPEDTDDGRALLASALAVPGDEVRDAIERLPALGSFEPLGAPRRGATVVLEAPGRRPLLVFGRWGLGRTAVLATDETWRWAFAAEAPREAYRALVREILASLVSPAAGLETPVALALDRECLPARAAIEASVAVTESASACAAFRATLQDELGAELAGASFARSREGATRFALDAPPVAAGELLLAVSALDAAGIELGRDSAFLRVAPTEREERVGEPAGASLLVRIADAGGGAAFAEADVTRGDARRVLASVLGPPQKAVRESRPLAQGAGYVLILALVLSASWGLRRGVGLR
jgi:hypothetical protein